jgi:hypothetical protein
MNRERSVVNKNAASAKKEGGNCIFIAICLDIR